MRLQGGVSVGTLEPGACSSNGAGAGTAWPGGWRVRWEAQQRGCVRFNCADSLDRTNAASYFCAVQARRDAACWLCRGGMVGYGMRACVRFSCADLLDRSNAASYFCAVQACSGTAANAQESSTGFLT